MLEERICKCGHDEEKYHNYYGGPHCGYNGCNCSKFVIAKKETPLECILSAVDVNNPWKYTQENALGSIVVLLADISRSLKKIADKEVYNCEVKNDR